MLLVLFGGGVLSAHCSCFLIFQIFLQSLASQRFFFKICFICSWLQSLDLYYYRFGHTEKQIYWQVGDPQGFAGGISLFSFPRFFLLSLPESLQSPISFSPSQLSANPLLCAHVFSFPSFLPMEAISWEILLDPAVAWIHLSSSGPAACQVIYKDFQGPSLSPVSCQLNLLLNKRHPQNNYWSPYNGQITNF